MKLKTALGAFCAIQPENGLGLFYMYSCQNNRACSIQNRTVL